MSISVLIADDHDIMRDTIRRMLEGRPDFRIVAEASDGETAVKLAGQHRPHVAIVDIGMKPMNGIEATALIARNSPETAVLILTVYNLEQYVLRALGAGARGYLLKGSLDEEELLGAIRTVRNGGRYFSEAVAGVVPGAFRSAGESI